MKKITLFLGMLAISSIAISQTTQPCPTFFKRSNGAGGGCPFGKLTLVYANCPTMALPIDSVYQNGVKINTSFAPGIIDCSGSQFQITYCISANIAPTGFLTIYFQGAGSFNSNTCTVPGGGPLPVILTDFYAKRSLTNVAVSWKSESEINAASYVLQRKSGLTSAFIDITTVKAGNQVTGGTYSFIDKNSFKDISQYRLKMIDLDGSFTISDIRTVKGISTVSDFAVFPNPSSGNSKITVADIAEPTDVQVLDNSGRILKTIPMNYSNSVDIYNLQKGMYLIRIVNKNSGESITKKLTVIN